MNFGKNLKESIEKDGYSQSDVDEKLNISRQSVSRWDNGWSCPDIDNLTALSQMYKIPIDDLLENTQTKDAQTKLENETTNNILGKIEQFFIVAVALLSCTVPVAGLILNIALCVYCFVKKIKLNPICWIIMLYCIIINISNLYTVLSIEIPSWGRENIEKISQI